MNLGSGAGATVVRLRHDTYMTLWSKAPERVQAKYVIAQLRRLCFISMQDVSHDIAIGIFAATVHWQHWETQRCHCAKIPIIVRVRAGT